MFAFLSALLILLTGDYLGTDSSSPGLEYEDSPAVIRLLTTHHALGLPTVRRHY